MDKKFICAVIFAILAFVICSCSDNVVKDNIRYAPISQVDTKPLVKMVHEYCSQKYSEAIPNNIQQFAFLNTCGFTTNIPSNSEFKATSYVVDGRQLISNDNNAAKGTVYTWYKEVNDDLYKNVNVENFYAKDYYQESSTGYGDLDNKDVMFKYHGSIGETPIKVEYIDYWNDDRQPDSRWIEYFKQKIENEIGYTDTPIIVSKAWIFKYNGKTCAAVVATNLQYPLKKTTKYAKLSVKESLPHGDNHIAYMYSTLFVGNDCTYDIFSPYCEKISDEYRLNENNSENSVCLYSFKPTADGDGHPHMAVQCDENGDWALYNYYDFCYNDNMIDRNFIIFDVNGDSAPELIFRNIDERGGYYSFTSMYCLQGNDLIPLANL